jgi:hypothetical protein
MAAEVEQRRGGPGQPQAPESREHRMVMRWVELDAVIQLLRNRRFQENLITAIIGLAALRHMGKESRTRMLTRVLEWDKRVAGRAQAAAEHATEHHRRR